ncbi:MAG TPA: hypothetical protein PKM23_12180 [bacterium]|nr:hypothetical protein [bacterium]
MKDTTKAVMRTFFFLGGAYLFYTAFMFKPEPNEKWFLAFCGFMLLLSSCRATWAGIIMIVLGMSFCGLEYYNLSQPGIGINPDLGGYIWGLISMIVGGVFFTFAPSKKKKDDQ